MHSFRRFLREIDRKIPNDFESPGWFKGHFISVLYRSGTCPRILTVYSHKARLTDPEKTVVVSKSEGVIDMIIDILEEIMRGHPRLVGNFVGFKPGFLVYARGKTKNSDVDHFAFDSSSPLKG